jgi:non-canonical (house-cleaning) NTP pyrophosphatase
LIFWFRGLTIMVRDLRAFWSRFQTGIEVAVARPAADKLLGIRDGFRRYFQEALGRSVPVVVVPHEESEDRNRLPLTDEETILLARRQALELQRRLGDAYHFYAGAEGGLHSVELEGGVHYFVRSWCVIVGLSGEAWGASGSVEIPQRLIGGLDDEQIPFAVPGTRRKGGMISSLTGGHETRRSAVAVATFHALSSAFYDRIESHPPRRD